MTQHANDHAVTKQPHVYSKAEGYQPDPKFEAGEFPKMLFRPHKEEGKPPEQVVVKNKEEEEADGAKGFSLEHAPSY